MTSHTIADVRYVFEYNTNPATDAEMLDALVGAGPLLLAKERRGALLAAQKKSEYQRYSVR